MLGLFFLLVMVGVFLFRFLMDFFKPGTASPFSMRGIVSTPPPVETDQKKRDAVIKQSFSAEKVPEVLDAIVIGSGAGGLTAAVILARAGHRVLVLEQHDQAGGCCHTFIEKGFEFDVGIHYVGKLGVRNKGFRLITDQLTDGKLDWVQLDDTFDTVILGEPGKNLRKYSIKSGSAEQYWAHLKSLFPNDQAKLDKLRARIRAVVKSSTWLGMAKLLPLPLLRFLHKTGLLNLLTNYFKLSEQTLQEAMEEFGGDNEDLRAVIGYCFGDWGGWPDQTSFTMQAFLLAHFRDGAFYPKGGASEIAYHMIPKIEAAGGKCLVKAEVKEILFNNFGKAYGVRVAKGSTTQDIFAPLIISDAGVLNTFKRLIPRPIAQESRYYKYTEEIGAGVAGVSLFVGLEGTKEELNLPAANFWCFPDANYTEACHRFYDGSFEDALSSPVPLLFLSFPSAKDPTWSERYPGKSTCTIVSFLNYSWFEKFEGKGTAKRRGEEYEGVKAEFARNLWEQAVRLFPQLEGKNTYFEMGSPLTNNHYIRSERGEIYGLDHSMKRFTPEAVMELRADTDIPGLYITGQDVMMCGFSGAVYGGVTCASRILNRQLFFDLFKLEKQAK